MDKQLDRLLRLRAYRLQATTLLLLAGRQSIGVDLVLQFRKGCLRMLLLASILPMFRRNLAESLLCSFHLADNMCLSSLLLLTVSSE